jgi:hypothetical protein
MNAICVLVNALSHRERSAVGDYSRPSAGALH